MVGMLGVMKLQKVSIWKRLLTMAGNYQITSIQNIIPTT